MEYYRRIRSTSGQQSTDAAKKPVQKKRFTRRVTTSLLRTSTSLISSFTTTVTESEAPDDDVINHHKIGDYKNSETHRHSIAECLSTAQVAQLVADEYFGQGEGEELFTKPSTLDSSEYAPGGIASQDKGSNDATSAGSRRSELVIEDNLAHEVALHAHAHLEECFSADVSVLDRKKFNAIPEITDSDVSITGHLGQGSFCDVFDVVCGSRQNDHVKTSKITFRGLLSEHKRPSKRQRPGSLVFAMKRLRPEIRADPLQFSIGAKDLAYETAILANLSHRNIIKLCGRALGPLTDTFTLNDGYFILLEKLQDTLHDRINAWKQTKCIRGSKTKQVRVAYSIADALAYLHAKKIVFRDLKPNNVGFDHLGNVKLFDFGLATGLPMKSESNPGGFLYDRCGTPRYMAPEVRNSELGYEKKADVYSIGMLLWEMCALEKPFSSITSADEFDRVVFEEGHRPELGKCWPWATKRLIRNCWAATPSERPTMLDVKSSLSLSMTGINS